MSETTTSLCGEAGPGDCVGILFGSVWDPLSRFLLRHVCEVTRGGGWAFKFSNNGYN